VRQDLVDHRRLGDARDDPHGPAARRTREGVDREDLLEEAAHRRVASVGASRGAETIAGGTAAAAVAALPRIPRGRLAYQP